MVRRKELLGLLLAAAFVGGPAAAASRRGHHVHAARHQARHAVRRYAGYGVDQPYSSSVSPTITCRYANGTPFDPDVIGGPNHVGDGGPAANLGGFDPCGY